MKDEELAKEYEEKAEYIEVDDYGKKRYDSIDIQRAFLAGLKADRPQWHDLRKDKNDLPDNSRFVWCDYGDGYDKGFYDKNDGCWLIEGHLYCSIINAWCELPTFDKETEK